MGDPHEQEGESLTPILNKCEFRGLAPNRRRVWWIALRLSPRLNNEGNLVERDTGLDIVDLNI